MSSPDIPWGDDILHDGKAAEAIQSIAAAMKQRDLTEEEVRLLLTLAARIYAAKSEESGAPFEPVRNDSGLSATDVMVISLGMLKSFNIAVFELATFQTWLKQ